MMFSRQSLTQFLQKLFRPATTDAKQHRPEWLVIGLGNPGEEYETTRHNMGYLCVDKLLEKEGLGLEKHKNAPAWTAQLMVADTPVLLVRSTTYMNDSGKAVAALAHHYDIAADHIIAVHDELDIATGVVRIKKGGGENGHNGLKSISQLLGTRDYVRIKMGIGRPERGTSVVDYVLEEYHDNKQVEQMATLAARGVRAVISEGIAQAQNDIHSQ
ncbi:MULTISPECIES: aminoacyl-tRNA hydrolase [unclassified Corynebacterium]|uniref:aminoacyl-tRNA hydrolase n=1 Tax=unclassified Corynebacterium TaxID=2624378 RepID=UPI001FEEA5B2|nr:MULTISPECIES: aminoacyl-tRNA hydrolase [unclassified Corynebacterium]